MAAQQTKPRVQVLYHRHHVWAQGPQRVLSGLASHLADTTVAVSQAAAEGARVQDHLRRRIVVAYNGVPAPTVGSQDGIALRRRLGIGREDAVIAIVARLRREKGHLELMRAFEELAPRLDRKVHLVIAGDGPERPTISSFLEGRRAESIHLLGHQRDVGPVYQAADVVAIPSTRESFGLTAAEAMACARPVVGYRVEGLPEVVESGVTGLLVPPRNTAALADALYSVLSDPRTATEMGVAGSQRHLERFTTVRMVGDWLAIYEAVGASPGAGSR